MKISRRTLLRGASAAVALPWLDAMAQSSSRAAENIQPPVRLAWFYVPNGVHMPNWKPTEAGQLNELPETLKSLEPVKDYVTVVSDLAADHCNGTSAAHEPAGGGFLVGGKCKHSEEPEVAGASVDQVFAKQVGHKTPVDSLALGIDPGHRGDHGYSGTYMSHISWRSKTSPAPLELNPKQLFQRLFRDRPPRHPQWSQGGAKTLTLSEDSIEGSILDVVREDTQTLQRQLGFGDRRKLEEYLDGLRSIEKRIALADKDSHSHHQDSFKNDPYADGDFSEIPKLIIPEGKGIPSEYAEHVNLMLDILVLAFQTDTTRVASFLFSYEKSGRSYPEIEAPGSHHSTSHHGGKAENHDQLTKINSHHMALFSRMLQRMAETREGERTLLDNVMICYGSGISDGNRHNHDDLPVIVAGGAGRKFAGGKHLAFEEKTPICNLYLEMLARGGVELASFGDSTDRLNLET
jgi:hypothetical protein